MIRFTNLSRFVLALICGFAVTAASPSWADTVSANASAFFSSTPCNVVASPTSATCSDNNLSGSTSSFADLASGTLTASVTGLGNAGATLTTALSFQIAPSYPAQNAYVTINLTLDQPGTVSGNALLQSELSFGNGTGLVANMCSGSETCTSSPLSLSIKVDLLSLSSLSNITLFAEVLAETNGPGGANTAIIDPTISLILPNGVTFTSQSGLFLTTPLPAALPLFATGLGGLGLLGWRRKRKQAVAL